MLRDLLDYLLFKTWTAHNEAVNTKNHFPLFVLSGFRIWCNFSMTLKCLGFTATA